MIAEIMIFVNICITVAFGIIMSMQIKHFSSAIIQKVPNRIAEEMESIFEEKRIEVSEQKDEIEKTTYKMQVIREIDKKMIAYFNSLESNEKDISNFFYKKIRQKIYEEYKWMEKRILELNGVENGQKTD